MKKTNRFIVMLLVLIVSTTTLSQDIFMSQLIQQELDQVDVGSSTVVVAGQVYKYKLDAENSSYQFPADAKTSLSLTDLRVGEEYYFEIVSRGKDMQTNKFSEVIFISSQKPSE